MGCVLGPTFANFYMGYIEEKVLSQAPFDIIYCRYVDDIFVTLKNESNLQWIKSEMEKKSILKFTYEINDDNTLHFLDVYIKISGDKQNFITSIFTKETNNGDCLNYISLCPFRYKVGVIKTFLHRAFNICSDWESFHLEVERIKQLLINNNYPTPVIDKTIRNFMNTKFNTNKND
jgi:hypothetical protein